MNITFELSVKPPGSWFLTNLTNYNKDQHEYRNELRAFRCELPAEAFPTNHQLNYEDMACTETDCRCFDSACTSVKLIIISRKSEMILGLYNPFNKRKNEMKFLLTYASFLILEMSLVSWKKRSGNKRKLPRIENLGKQSVIQQPSQAVYWQTTYCEHPVFRALESSPQIGLLSGSLKHKNERLLMGIVNIQKCLNLKISLFQFEE